MSRRWHVICTMPQHEKKVASRLKRLGIDHYLPIQRRKRKWSDRIKMIDFPLFPGYVFVKINWQTDHLAVVTVPGVRGFIRQDDSASTVNDDEVRNLQLIVNSAHELKSGSDDKFPKGQTVKILFGAFKGVEGVVVKTKNKHRLYVRMKLLGRMVSTEIDAVDVEKGY